MGDIGIDINNDSSFKNYEELEKRIKHANECRCYFEELSLRILRIDIFLRFFLKAKMRDFDKTEKLTLGNLLTKCKKYTFDKHLLGELLQLNAKRNLGIHNFISKGEPYDNFESVVKEAKKISGEILQYISKNIGKKIV